ncbi:MAG: hypothetical protein ACO3JG_06895 [Luteolibacter sp.]
MDGIIILIPLAPVVFSIIAFLASFLYQKFVPGDARRDDTREKTP